MTQDKMGLPFHHVGPGQSQKQFLLHFPTWSCLVLVSYSPASAATTRFLTLVMGKCGELDSPWPVFSSGDLPTGLPWGGGDEASLRIRL